MSFAYRFNDLSRLLLAYLLLDVVLLDTMLPFLLFVVFTDAVATLPAPIIPLIGVGAWTLSGPGVVAAFAAFRDAPVLRIGESDQARFARQDRTANIPAIAGPYWTDAEDTALIRPYFRSYVRLLGRSLVTSLVFGTILAVLTLAASASLSTPGSSAVPAGVLIALAAYTLLAELAAFTMVVEFPRARLGALLRNAYLLTARGWYWSLAALVVVALLLYALLNWPYLVIIFGTGLALFFVFHLCTAVVRPVRDLVIAEESAPVDH